MQPTTMERVAIHAIWRGTVQGVGFRATVRRAARRAGLAGWVRNRGDGSVEGLLQGLPEAIEAALRAIHRERDRFVTSFERAERPIDDGLGTFEISSTLEGAP